MEAVIFIGIQATGKSTFYNKRFFDSHIRINLDMLRTRNRERILTEACLEAKQRFVSDNTNLTKDNRKKIIKKAKNNRFKVIGYYFQSKLKDSIKRNNKRTGKSKIPERGLRGAFSQMEIPTIDEGFDELFYVRIEKDKFIVEEWKNEV